MDFKKIDEQLASRSQDQVKTLFTTNLKNAELIFALGPTDSGVARNGGRKGARFAPQAIMNILKKFSVHKKSPLYEQNFINQSMENDSFELAQKNYKDSLLKAMQSKKEKCSFVHIGGGHDHIYPFLKAIEESSTAPLVIVNIDAHCDTRQDALFHSGTPFRQFDNTATRPFKLYQFGIHDFANSSSTQEKLSMGEMKIFRSRNLPKDFEQIKRFMEDKVSLEEGDQLIISLDADALSADTMEAVSAVNPKGLSIDQVSGIFHWARYRSQGPSRYYGLYEYNPILDNLSQKGARTLAGLLYELFLAP